jgi:hypothetical protein
VFHDLRCLVSTLFILLVVELLSINSLQDAIRLSFRYMRDSKWNSTYNPYTVPWQENFQSGLIPVGALAGVDPTPAGAMDVGVVAGHSGQKDATGAFETVGERVYAVCYRQIVLGFVRVEQKADLKAGNRWTAFSHTRGKDDSVSIPSDNLYNSFQTLRRRYFNTIQKKIGL